MIGGKGDFSFSFVKGRGIHRSIMKHVFTLNPEHLMGLESGQRVLVTTWISDDVLFCDSPALVVGCESGDFVFVYIGEDGSAKQARLPIDKYGTIWNASIEDGFCIETPDGILHASGILNSEYPGIEINLYRPGDDYPIRLSMTEYIPGGECLCGFDPAHPEESQREIDEVPAERIVTTDGKHITSKDGIHYSNSGNYRITAGLVSRAWPNEVEDEDDHRRVFHSGYKKEGDAE